MKLFAVYGYDRAALNLVSALKRDWKRQKRASQRITPMYSPSP
jgi:hypothetical protein